MIRFAMEKDIPRIMDLLAQVNLVHHMGRPDIFKRGTKYSAEDLRRLLLDENRPILVSVDENDDLRGYCFCILRQHVNNPLLTDVKTLYIDDLCVDENRRGQRIGGILYDYATAYAKEIGCNYLTLNVWCGNDGAIRFYERAGMKQRSITMEKELC